MILGNHLHLIESVKNELMILSAVAQNSVMLNRTFRNTRYRLSNLNVGKSSFLKGLFVF